MTIYSKTYSSIEKLAQSGANLARTGVFLGALGLSSLLSGCRAPYEPPSKEQLEFHKRYVAERLENKIEGKTTEEFAKGALKGIQEIGQNQYSLGFEPRDYKQVFGDKGVEILRQMGDYTEGARRAGRGLEIMLLHNYGMRNRIDSLRSAVAKDSKGDNFLDILPKEVVKQTLEAIAQEKNLLVALGNKNFDYGDIVSLLDKAERSGNKDLAGKTKAAVNEFKKRMNELRILYTLDSALVLSEFNAAEAGNLLQRAVNIAKLEEYSSGINLLNLGEKIDETYCPELDKKVQGVAGRLAQAEPDSSDDAIRRNRFSIFKSLDEQLKSKGAKLSPLERDAARAYIDYKIAEECLKKPASPAWRVILTEVLTSMALGYNGYLAVNHGTHCFAPDRAEAATRQCGPDGKTGVDETRAVMATLSNEILFLNGATNSAWFVGNQGNVIRATVTHGVMQVLEAAALAYTAYTLGQNKPGSSGNSGTPAQTGTGNPNPAPAPTPTPTPTPIPPAPTPY